MLRSQNIKPYALDFNNLKFISSQFHNKIQKSSLNSGDIVIVRTGSPGTACVIPENMGELNCSDLVIVTPNVSKINPYFLSFYFNSIAAHYVNSQLVGAVQQHFNVGSAKRMEIKIPTLQEQEEIVSVLKCLQDKIELNLQMNRTLEEMAMTLYKHWFVDFGPFQDGEFVDSELGKIPKDWRIADLGDVSEMIAGGDKPINYSYQPNEACKIPIYSNGLTNEGLYGYTDRPRIDQESITVSARGTIGFVCLRMQPYFPIVRLISVIPNQDYISSKYLYLLLKNQNIRGTGTTQQQLTVPDFKKTKVIIPKIELVNDFTFIMDSIFNNIRSNKSEVKTLSQTRDTILPKLISGEVRVKDIEQTVTAVL